jgi:hypothetical protein
MHRSLRQAQGRLFVGSRSLCARLRFPRMTSENPSRFLTGLSARFGMTSLFHCLDNESPL